MTNNAVWPNSCAASILSGFGSTVTAHPSEHDRKVLAIKFLRNRLHFALIDDHQVVDGVEKKLRKLGFKLMATGIPGNSGANLHILVGGDERKLAAIQDLGDIPLIARDAYEESVEKSRAQWDLSSGFVDEKMSLYDTKYNRDTRELVFVYGTLKRGYGNHDVMKMAGGEFLGEDKLQRHQMYTNGAFPMIVPGLAARCVRGEVFAVNSLRGLDQLEGYREDDPEGSMYMRQEVELKSGRRVWTYVWNRKIEENAERIASGNF